MRIVCAIVLSAAAVVGFCSWIVPLGAAEHPKPQPPPLNQFEDHVQSRVRKNGFSGSVLVARDGRAIFAKGYGLANREHDVPNTPQTKFRIGSVTKQITAVALLMLVQQGKLQLDDPARKYLPEMPEAWEKVTIHQLLSHTGGIPEHTSLPAFRERMGLPATATDVLRLVRDKPLTASPGEKFQYCNTGYILLGMVLEKVTGQSYGAWLRNNVFGPLGMETSGYDEPGLILKGRASGYARRGDGLVHADTIHMSWPGAAGGLYSTVEDLLRLSTALDTDKLLGTELRKKMFTPVQRDYGYGWRIHKRFGRPATEHGGSIPGFQSYVIRFPEERLFVAVLSNIRPTPVAEVAADLAGIALGEKASAPDKR